MTATTRPACGFCGQVGNDDASMYGSFPYLAGNCLIDLFTVTTLYREEKEEKEKDYCLCCNTAVATAEIIGHTSDGDVLFTPVCSDCLETRHYKDKRLICMDCLDNEVLPMYMANKVKARNDRG